MNVMKKLIIILVLPVLLLFPLAPIKQPIELNIEGSCRDFNVSVENLYPGCYDLKVDITNLNGRVGEIFDPRVGWKSSFFYVKELCIEGESIKLQTRAYTNDRILNFKAFFRSGSTEWESEYYEIIQDCPGGLEEENMEMFFVPVLIAIMIILVGIVLYVKILK